MSKVKDKAREAKEQEEPVKFKVEDRRHWARSEEEKAKEEEGEKSSPYPTIVDEYRQRSEAAEQKLQEYIEAFKQHQQEQEQFRERLNRDVERKVELALCGILADLVQTLDDLELALSHVQNVPEAGPLAEGVALARDRFLSSLEKHGVEKIQPDDEAFDPNVAEAVRTTPVDSPEQDGKVTETLRPGFKLGDQVIRPARVTVGKFQA